MDLQMPATMTDLEAMGTRLYNKFEAWTRKLEFSQRLC